MGGFVGGVGDPNLWPRRRDCPAGGVEPRPYARSTEGACVYVSGGQSRPPLQSSNAPAHRACPVIPSQSSDWRGNPFPAPAGAASPPSAREVAKPKVLTEGEICHGSAVASSLTCVKGGGMAFGHAGGIVLRAGQSPAPTHALSKARAYTFRADRVVRPYTPPDTPRERPLASPLGRGGRAQRGRRGQTKEGPPPGGPSFMQFLQPFSTSRTPRQYPYRRRCTGWPGPSWPRAASASRAAGSR